MERSGRLARTSGVPPYGSLYAARAAPPALAIRFVISATLSSPRSIAPSVGSGPRGAAGPRLRVPFRTVFLVVVFFAGIGRTIGPPSAQRETVAAEASAHAGHRQDHPVPHVGESLHHR